MNGIDSNNVSLKEFVARIFDEKEKAQEQAVKALEARMHILNDWKELTIRERQTFVDLRAYNVAYEALREKIDHLNAQMKAVVAVASLLSGIAGGIIGAVIRSIFGF